jgi:predicted Zn-dependent peptidase
MAKSTGASALEALTPLITTLSNGLRVVAANLPSVHRISMTAQLRVGSRYESADNNGISHLLEHMLYRGIPGCPTAHEQALAFETLGGTLVAATGSDSGSLAISCPPSNFEETLALFGRVYREPLLGGLDVEKRIVREEILEDLDEDGTLVDDYDLLRAAAFEGHPLGLPVIGTVAHIDRFDVASLRAHHEKHYVGRGSVVAVVGPIDPEMATRAVERHFGAVPRGEVVVVDAPAPQTASRLRFVKNSSSQTALRVAFRGPGIADASEPATELLLRLLDDGNSTRLYTRLCDERGLAYDVSAGYDAAEDTGLLDIGCEMAHERATTALGEILHVVRELRDVGASAAEIAKAKARHLWGLAEMLDDPGELAEFLADAMLRGYTSSLLARAEQIDAVDANAIAAVAARLFVPEGMTSVVVGLQPKRTEAQLARMLREFR